MSEILLDAGAWLDLVAGRRRIPSEFQGRTAVVCVTAVAEVATVCEQGRFPRDWVGRLLAENRVAECAVADFLEAGILHGRLRLDGNRKVSVLDCVAYRVAQRLGLPFVTGDRDLVGQPGVHLL